MDSKNDLVVKMENKIKIFKERFQDQNDGNLVEALTMIIDGSLKDGLDLILEANPRYKDYQDVVFDALLKGLDSIKEETFNRH